MSEALAHPPQRLVGRLLMTVATLMYSLVPVVVDFTETHVFHPDWPPHARFHMVWLLGLLCGVAVVSLYFIWRFDADRAFGRRMATGLGLLALMSFYASAATARLYGGALADTGGVAPIFGIDANVLSFTLCAVLLLSGSRLARHRESG